MEPFEFTSNGGGGEALPRRVKRRNATFYEVIKLDRANNVENRCRLYHENNHFFSYSAGQCILHSYLSFELYVEFLHPIPDCYSRNPQDPGSLRLVTTRLFKGT